MVGMMKYCVDIVFCIDATGSMVPIINKVKQYALDFYGKVKNEMESQGREVSQLRVKVITFRDFGDSKASPMDQSIFFTLDDEKVEFDNYVAGINAVGGGDIPENSLEAIVEAIRSDWTLEGAKRRQIVVVFTDAPALKLGERASAPCYPGEMPATLDDLNLMWSGAEPFGATTYDPEAGRLVIVAPDAEPWNVMEGTFDRCWYKKTEPGKGLDDVNMDDVINLIVKSISSINQ